MIRIIKADKHFDNVHALKAVSLHVKKGSVFGLV